MEEIRGRIEVVPDPELILKKVWKIHKNNSMPAGIFFMAVGIWWLLTNLKLLPRILLGPGIMMIAGLMCFAKAGMHKKEWRKGQVHPSD